MAHGNVGRFPCTSALLMFAAIRIVVTGIEQTTNTRHVSCGPETKIDRSFISWIALVAGARVSFAPWPRRFWTARLSYGQRLFWLCGARTARAVCTFNFKLSCPPSIFCRSPWTAPLCRPSWPSLTRARRRSISRPLCTATSAARTSTR